jgi:hypothetical protein
MDLCSEWLLFDLSSAAEYGVYPSVAESEAIVADGEAEMLFPALH